VGSVPINTYEADILFRVSLNSFKFLSIIYILYFIYLIVFESFD